MTKYDALEFLSHFGWLIACKGGVGESVRPIDCQRDMGLSRSAVYNHIGNLMERNYIKKVSYGRYAPSFDVGNIGVAVSIVNFMDVMSYTNNPTEFLAQFVTENCKGRNDVS